LCIQDLSLGLLCERLYPIEKMANHLEFKNLDMQYMPGNRQKFPKDNSGFKSEMVAKLKSINSITRF